jgi:type I restriction enzyme, S subunit
LTDEHRGDNRWKRRYKPALPADHVPSPTLPAGWMNVTLGELAWDVKDGPHYSPPYTGGDVGIPFITGGNVRPEGIDFVSAKRISLELHSELSRRCKPQKGDVLYTKGGTTGIARVNTYDLDFNVWVHVAVLKLIPSVDPFYLQHALNSPSCYAQAQRFTHGVGSQDLGLTRMVRITFGLPPLAEQRRIVVEVDRRLSLISEVARLIEATLRRCERLRNALLEAAFSGRTGVREITEEVTRLTNAQQVLA